MQMARGRALLAARDFEAAAQHFAAAAGCAPDVSSRYTAMLGEVRALGDAGLVEAASSIARRAIATLPERATAHAMLALLLERAERLDEAADAASAAIARSPRDGHLRNLAASIALRRRKDSSAAAHSRAALARDPHDQRALADLWLALRRCGRHEEARRLLDIDSAIHIEPPSEVDPALIRSILAHPGLAEATTDGPLSGGRRLPDLFALPAPLLQPVRARVAAAATVHACSFSSDHPVSTGRPDVMTMHGWANAIGPGGSERAHIHEAGWLSAVLYLDMPPAGEGAIVLGRHLLDEDGACPIRTLSPSPGSLIVFPSFLYHHTRPFTGTGRRISIAIDILRDPPA